MADEPSTDIDFVRFLGVRIVDAESDERACKVVEGSSDLGLRTDASLLAISNRYGAIFVGGAQGCRWAWLAELRAACVAGADPEAAATALCDCVTERGTPFVISLNADETTLAVVGDDRMVGLYDVLTILSGGCARSSGRIRRSQPLLRDAAPSLFSCSHVHPPFAHVAVQCGASRHGAASRRRCAAVAMAGRAIAAPARSPNPRDPAHLQRPARPRAALLEASPLCFLTL